MGTQLDFFGFITAKFQTWME